MASGVQAQVFGLTVCVSVLHPNKQESFWLCLVRDADRSCRLWRGSELLSSLLQPSRSLLPDPCVHPCPLVTPQPTVR